VILALGSIAWNAMLDHARRSGVTVPSPRPRFEHGAVVQLSGMPTLVASYHVSQQNTQTGRLTNAMFDAILRRCVAITER
jgi:uracil-DNA glycosylase